MDSRQKIQQTIQKVAFRNGKPKIPPVPILRAINRVRAGFSKIHKNLVPPPVAMLEMISGQWISRTISVFAKFGIADHIDEAGTSSDEIAKKASVDADALYRILRALSVIDVATELEGRRFKLTSVGKTLRTDHPQSMRHVAIFQGSLNWECWGELDHCLKTGKNAAEKVFGEKPFDHLAKHPEKAEIFDRAMTNISAMEVDAIVAAYSFAEFKTIADVGGGHGALLSAVLSTHPQAKGILFDLPHVVEAAKGETAKRGLTGRVDFQPGSFFDSAPAGADAYMMKHIIHDWSEEESIKIMKNIRAKIPAHGKLLLLEAVIPGRNVPHFGKFLDIEMLVVTTGRERTEEEYRALLAKAGFRLEQIVSTAAMASVIEATPV